MLSFFSFSPMFLCSGRRDWKSLLIISSETTARNIMKLYMMIVYGPPSCMPILTCWFWHQLRIYAQIRKFRKSSISPKLLNGFQSLIPLCVGLSVCYIFASYCYHRNRVNEDIMFEKLILHKFLHSSTKIQLRSLKLTISPCRSTNYLQIICSLQRCTFVSKWAN